MSEHKDKLRSTVGSNTSRIGFYIDGELIKTEEFPMRYLNTEDWNNKMKAMEDWDKISPNHTSKHI